MPPKRRKRAIEKDDGSAVDQPRPQRRRIAATAPNPDTDPGALGQADSHSTIQQQVKEIIDAAIPEITRAVMDAFKGVSGDAAHGVPGAFSGISRPDTTASVQQAASELGVEGLQPMPLAAWTGTSRHVQSPMARSARPLDSSVDSKIKSKIWTNEYVELGALLSQNQSAADTKLEVINAGGQVCLVQKRVRFTITTMDQWCAAFRTFVAVYCRRFPVDSVSLMTYMNQVQTVARQAGDAAAIYYDEQFRKVREQKPTRHPWDVPNEIFYILAQSLTAKMVSFESPPFRVRSRVDAFPAAGTAPPANAVSVTAQPGKAQYCYRYTNAGQCDRPSCPFSHICQRCGGPHPRRVCRRDAPSTGIASYGGAKPPIRK